MFIDKTLSDIQPLQSVLVNTEYYTAEQPGRDDYWRKMAAPRARMREYIRVIKGLKPRCVVDLGCGGGNLLREIKTLCPQASLVGIDLVERQMAVNRKHFPEATWIAADLCDPMALSAKTGVPFGKADVVIASELIEHLDHPREFLQSARKLLAPGGRLLLSTQSGVIRETEKRVGHCRHFSAEEMRAMLRETGWEPVKVWNMGFPFHDLSKWYANLDPAGSMERFSERSYGLKENLICWLLNLIFTFNSRSRGAQLFAIATPGKD